MLTSTFRTVDHQEYPQSSRCTTIQEKPTVGSKLIFTRAESNRHTALLFKACGVFERWENQSSNVASHWGSWAGFAALTDY